MGDSVDFFDIFTKRQKGERCCICLNDGEHLATNIYISQSTLYRLFKDKLGIMPAKYIEAKRMSLAKSMLLEEKSLCEICSACGYNNCSHFVIEKFSLRDLCEYVQRAG